MGIGSTMGDFTLKYATGSDATHNTSGGETSKIDTNNWSVYYGGLENMTVYYVGVASEEKTGDNSGDKLDSSTIGLSYTITDGVSALINLVTMTTPTAPIRQIMISQTTHGSAYL